jgi:nicotinamide phosphoribosyltransferase
MFDINPALAADFYKISHKDMYPEGTTMVHSVFIARRSMIDGIDHIVNFGISYALETLYEFWEKNFFEKAIDAICWEYESVIYKALGVMPNTKHLRDLHDYDRLPLLFRTLPEGIKIPIGCPILTVECTHSKFYWLTNFIETMLSCSLWQIITSATLANRFQMLFRGYEDLTHDNNGFYLYQGHDFSMRGMSSLESAIASGMGHLSSFVGTDTIPAILAMNKYYDVSDCVVGASVPATEHSIQCSYANDENYISEMMDRYPTGIISIVADGYDFWHVISELLPRLKNKIMARDGKVVIRPDSGNPVDIVCGTDAPSDSEWVKKGAIESLWDIFGGTTNDKGYKELDSHIGLIYGDAISFDRAQEILHLLAMKDFASCNVVFGIGSYTYQHNTRDTFGFAMKATAVEINGQIKTIFKSPKTDDGTKKSPAGFPVVYPEEGKLKWEFYPSPMVTTYCKNILKPWVGSSSLKEIREKIIKG